MSKKVKWSEKNFQIEENNLSQKRKSLPEQKFFTIKTNHKCSELLDKDASLVGLKKPAQVWRKQERVFSEMNYKLKFRNNFFEIAESKEIVKNKIEELSSIIIKKPKRVRTNKKYTKNNEIR